MRPVREITEKEEGARVEPFVGNNMVTIKRNFVKREPEGTIILLAFKVTGYDKDCDGSAMVRAEQIDSKGETTGWDIDHIGLYSHTALVVSSEELESLFT